MWSEGPPAPQWAQPQVDERQRPARQVLWRQVLWQQVLWQQLLWQQVGRQQVGRQQVGRQPVGQVGRQLARRRPARQVLWRQAGMAGVAEVSRLVLSPPRSPDGLSPAPISRSESVRQTGELPQQARRSSPAPRQGSLAYQRQLAWVWSPREVGLRASSRPVLGPRPDAAGFRGPPYGGLGRLERPRSKTNGS
jgi:hypothetical protein